MARKLYPSEKKLVITTNAGLEQLTDAVIVQMIDTQRRAGNNLITVKNFGSLVDINDKSQDFRVFPLIMKLESYSKVAGITCKFDGIDVLYDRYQKYLTDLEDRKIHASRSPSPSSDVSG